MQTISIGDFRANLLKYLEIANADEPISITLNGRLLATISAPIQQRDSTPARFINFRGVIYVTYS